MYSVTVTVYRLHGLQLTRLCIVNAHSVSVFVLCFELNADLASGSVIIGCPQTWADRMAMTMSSQYSLHLFIQLLPQLVLSAEGTTPNQSLTLPGSSRYIWQLGLK